MRDQFQEFQWVLREADRKATEILNRVPSSFIFLSMLTLMGLHRTPPHLPVCPASPVCVTSLLGRSSFEINRLSYSHSIPLLFPCALPVDLEQSQFYLNIYHPRCVSRETCYSFVSPCPRVFFFVPTFCIILIKHNSLGSPSLSQWISYPSNITRLSTEFLFP